MRQPERINACAHGMCAGGAGRQILISQRVLSAVEPLVQAEPVGELELKGFARPVAGLAGE